MLFDEVHLDKNGNPMKGAALTSHIVYSHFNGLDDFAKSIAEATLALDKQRRPKSRSGATLTRRGHLIKNTLGRLTRMKWG